MATVRITSWNLNGIRAAERRGMTEWLTSFQPDVLLLQEVRAPDEIVTTILGEDWLVWSHPSEIKGRAGVAVAVRRGGPFNGGEVTAGLGAGEAPEDTGRWLEVDLSGPVPLTAVSAYFHAGQVGTPRQEAKMRHLPMIDNRLEYLLERGNPALVGGDFNIVRSEQDIKNWKGNYNKTSGVLDEEIAYVNDWVSRGWRDVVRDLAGSSQGPYSWWSWRGKAFDNDAGWRIDYHYATSSWAGRAKSYDIFRAPDWTQRISDHAPVTVTYEL